jgi:cellulose synthase/poly-beta-1,6-N-acetylglucosamine synthase-like glycosyltransferase
MRPNKKTPLYKKGTLKAANSGYRGLTHKLRHLWQLAPDISAKQLLSFHQKLGLLLLAGAVSILMLISPIPAIEGVVFLIQSCFLITMLYKAIIFFYGMRNRRMQTLPISARHPLYTIMLPLYKEANIVEKLVHNICNIRYPHDKLQVLLILEQDDEATISTISKLKLPHYFETVIVPHSHPKTKGKACNFALQFVRGEFLVIYDAEDKPDHKQLQKAVSAFNFYGPKVVCVQAKLNYYNRKSNLLTSLFSIEYRLLFDIMLRGLEACNLPIPLGGTSNHIRVTALKQLGGWDSYNVTEDADLGMRFYYHGYQVRMLNSYTMEEAPSQLGTWLKQRCRWLKGYLQTFFVFTRNSLNFVEQTGVSGYLSFLVFVGLSTFSFLCIPILFFLVMAILLFQMDTPVTKFILHLCYFNLMLNSCQLIMMGKLASHKKNNKCIFLPFYYLLHVLAAYKAITELRTKLHYWHKTKHGQDYTKFQIKLDE